MTRAPKIKINKSYEFNKVTKQAQTKINYRNKNGKLKFTEIIIQINQTR